MADNLAKQGYFVLAVDLFNGQIANTTDIAKRLVTKVGENSSEATSSLQSAVR